jgi:hypothetical protein
VDIALRSAEHLFFLVQQGRSTLHALASNLAHLDRVCAMLHSLSDAQLSDAGIPALKPLQQRSLQQLELLNSLLQLTNETAALLSAASMAETAPQPRRLLEAVSAHLGSVAAVLEGWIQELVACLHVAVELPDSGVLLAPSCKRCLQANVERLAVLHAELSQGEGFAHDLPGFRALVSFLGKALQSQQTVTAPSAPPKGLQPNSCEQQLLDSLEAAVTSSLLWAQKVRTAEADAQLVVDGEHYAEAEQQPIPVILRALEKQLGLATAGDVGRHAVSALAALAEAVELQNGNTLIPMLCTLGPMLSMLCSALRQLAMRYLAAHKHVCKLSYVITSLFGGLMEEGFCMPEGAEGKQSDILMIQMQHACCVGMQNLS